MGVWAGAFLAIAGVAAALDALGVGSRVSSLARVQAGCAVTAPAKEFSHFLRKATVLVLDHGDSGTVGVNLMVPTLLTIGEAVKGVRAVAHPT